MKKYFLMTIVTIFLFLSCKNVHYPDIPINVIAIKQESGCMLNWDPSPADVSCNEQDNIFYIILRNVNINSPYKVIGKTKKGVTEFLDRDVQQGRIYNYIIYASWDHYRSNPSLPVTVDYTK